MLRSDVGAVSVTMSNDVEVMFSTQTRALPYGVASTLLGAAAKPWLTVILVEPAAIVAVPLFSDM
jgi:hypothetical protein